MEHHGTKRFEMDGSSKTLMNACQLKITRKSFFRFTFIPTVNIAIGRRSFIQRVRVCVSLIVREREKGVKRKRALACVHVCVYCVYGCACVYGCTCVPICKIGKGERRRGSLFPECF